LLNETDNPLHLMKRRIVDHMYRTYRKTASSSPLFTVCENQPRIVSVWQNFDSLLTPIDHVSRRPSDTYYVNRDHCLRAHTSAHQHELIQAGLDNFLVIGDVYRRDEIDRTHYPCFHQMEGVRLYSSEELFKPSAFDKTPKMFEEGIRTIEKQECHTREASRLMEHELKSVLESLCQSLFGQECEMRWVNAYFPFTHPSFELEVFYNGRWLETIGCGIIEQRLLQSAGASMKAGWAFGLGLERLAMVLYQIPDIRLFWSNDSGFRSQFAGKKPSDTVIYKEISAHPQVAMDLSFWLAADVDFVNMKADALDLIRNIGGDLVEQVALYDEFVNKNGRRSQCYRIVYRSMERALTKDEVNIVHKQMERQLATQFACEIR